MGAFQADLEARLAHGKYTSWASDLSEDTLEALLWMIGEFGVRTPRDTRTDHLPDIVPADRIMNARMKEALCTIARIVHGERMDLEEARRRIRLAVVTVPPGSNGPTSEE